MSLKFKETIFKFIKEASEIEGVIQIVLFGSVAKGKAKKGSDIDFFVVLEDRERKKVQQIARKLNKVSKNRIELTLSDKEFSGYDESFIADVYGEGIVLFSREPCLKIKGIELEPKALFSFSLRELDQSDKMKIKRALYGSKSYSTYKGKKYISKIKGLVSEKGKLGRGAILVSKKTAQHVKEVFERYGVRYKKIDVWT